MLPASSANRGCSQSIAEDGLGGGVGQDGRTGDGGVVQLRDTRDRDVADLPAQHAHPPDLALGRHSMTVMPKLLLLDGHSLAYRAFFALPTDLATKAGTVTNAVYGFTSMLTKVMADEQPDHIAVAFDAPGGSTYRNELDAEYKAGRKETPDLFRSQLPLIHEVLEALEITQLEIKGVEADDVIATLATQAAAQGMDVVIVTGDRDSYQLVHDPHIKVLYNKRGVSDYVLYDEAGIAERCLGVTPAQYLDYASLRGDTSDNLPGVPGIGEKTAAKLITTYGGLEGVYDHLDELPPKQRTNLAEAKDRVFKNREMSRLTRDVDLDGIGPDDLRQGAFDRERVPRAVQPTRVPAPVAAHPRRGRRRRRDARRRHAGGRRCDRARRSRGSRRPARAAAKGERVAIEARWAGVIGRSAVTGLAISNGEDATYIDGDLLTDPEVRSAFDEIDRPDGPPLVVHRAKELMHGLERELRSLDRDTAVMAYLLDPGEGKYLLEDLALRYLSLELTSPDAVEGTLDFDGEANGRETGRRVAVLARLSDSLAEALAARELVSLYESIERPLVPVLAKMESAGVRIDVAFLEELGKELGDECRRLESEIHAHAGEQFNVNSTPQLRRILFDQLGLVPVKKTKTGPSTDADSLQKLARGAPDRRDAAALPRGREAPEYLRRRAAAARPCRRAHPRDVQPARDDDGPHLERVAEPAERPGAHVDRPRAAQGLHRRRRLWAAHRRLLADRVAGARASRRRPGVDRGVRARCRRAHHYRGRGVPRRRGQGRRLPAALRQGRELRARVRHGGVRPRHPARHPHRPGPRDPRRVLRRLPQHRHVHDRDDPRGEVDRLHHDAVRPAPPVTRAVVRQLPHPPDGRAHGAERAGAGRARPTSSRSSMVDLDRALTAGGFRSRMVLTVHDELVLEVPLDEREKVTEVVRDTMENVTELRVPLVVDIGFGSTWADAK